MARTDFLFRGSETVLAVLWAVRLAAADPTNTPAPAAASPTNAPAPAAVVAAPPPAPAVPPAPALMQAVSAMNPSAALELAGLGAGGLGSITELARRQPRAGAMWAWAVTQRPFPEAAPLLRELVVSNRNEQVCGYWAALALGALRDREAVGVLASQVSDKPNHYWEFAFGGRTRLTPDIGDRKAEEAPSGMPNIRVAYASLLALGAIGGPEAVAVLTRAAGGEPYPIREAACRGMGSLGAEAPAALLERLAASDPVLVVRSSARAALQRIRGAAPAADAPLPPMPGALVFLRTANRSESNLGFRDSYFFDKTPWYASGENLFVLSPVWPRERQQVRNLTNLDGGAVQGAELSWDGQRVIFAMRRNAKTDGFHLFEIGIDGSGLRQLTDGNCNDVDPCYLSDGRILFGSDRAGYQELYHQERSRVLHVMESDGTGIRQVTFNPNQDYDPVVLRNGQVIYSSYRFYAQDGSPAPLPGENHMQRIETVLRRMMPDGSADDLFYGAMRGSYFTPMRPTSDSLQYSGWSPRGYHIGVAVSQPREMPDGRIVCMTPAGLTLVDPARPIVDAEIPLWPEILNLAGGEEVYIHNHDEMNPCGRWTSPYPAAPPGAPEEAGAWVWAAHAPWYDLRGSAYGLVLLHTGTRKVVPVFDDPAASEVEPLAVWPRPAPPSRIASRREDAATGRILCASVFHSDLPFPREAVRRVRAIAAVSEGISINANASFRTRLLGEAPVEKDGSFFVEVPADTPLRFVLLDAAGRTLVHESEFNSVRGGETKGCVGCHEPRDRAAQSMARPLAALHPPARLEAKPGDPVYQGTTSVTYGGILRE